MKFSCDEGLASHVGPESCGGDRKVIVEALTDFGERGRTGEDARRVLSLENVTLIAQAHPIVAAPSAVHADRDHRHGGKQRQRPMNNVQ